MLQMRLMITKEAKARTSEYLLNKQVKIQNNSIAQQIEDFIREDIFNDSNANEDSYFIITIKKVDNANRPIR